MNLNIDTISEAICRVIQEMRDDNLHQFKEYLLSHGRPGMLEGDGVSLWDVLEDAEFDYEAKSAIINSDGIEVYADRNGHNDIYDCYDEYAERVKRGLMDYMKDYVHIENGLIEIHRSVKIDLLGGSKDGSKQMLEMMYDGHVGEYWSYAFGQVIEGAYVDGQEVVFHGKVKASDISAKDTLSANYIYPSEYEISIPHNTEVEVDRITIYRNDKEYTIWNQPIIMLA